jgi:carbon storage regulator
VLVLARYAEERIIVGDDIIITVLSARSGLAKIGVEAPPGVVIVREELLPPDDPRRGKRGPS